MTDRQSDKAKHLRKTEKQTAGLMGSWTDQTDSQTRVGTADKQTIELVDIKDKNIIVQV